MKTHSKLTVFLIVVVVTGMALSRASAQTLPKLQVATLLAEHFETVAYSDSRFLRNFKSDTEHDESLNALQLPYAEMLAELAVMGPSTEHDVVNSYTSFLAGAQGFVAPTGLGLVLSTKCYVGVREEAGQPDLTRDFGHANYNSIAGIQAWAWSLPPYEGNSKWTAVYAAQIGGHYFVMGNNRDEFQAVAQALNSFDQKPHAQLATFDQAGITGHQYWVYRSIRRDGVADNEAAGLTNMNPDIASISFYADISNRHGVIRVLSSDRSMKARPRVLPDSEVWRFRSTAPGIWEAPMDLKQQDRANLEALTRLFYSFGLGLAL